MPNHITNIVTFRGPSERVAQIREEIKGEKEVIDFNAIAPMPERLRNFQPCVGAVAHAKTRAGCADRWDAMSASIPLHPSEVADEERCFRNIERCGFAYWRDWAIAHWGTKWNAYDQSAVSDDTIQFDTAWSMPRRLLGSMTERYPDIEIVWIYADEDVGSNCGTITARGNQWGEMRPEGDEAVRFACEVKGYDFEEYMSEIED